MIGGGIIGAILLVGVVLLVMDLFDDSDDFPPIQAATSQHENIPSEPYFLGDPDAPVHLTEWSDYQ